MKKETIEHGKKKADHELADEIEKEFLNFCSGSYLKAEGGCCNLVHTIDEFLPGSDRKKEV